MRKEDRVVKSISEFVGFLSSDTEGLKEPVWYRGLSTKEYKLLPVTARETCDTELGLIKKFKQNAKLHVNPVPSNSQEWLFVMRHHGVPTRLLDWSESPLVAAFFSAIKHDDRDGAIWALMPLELNKAYGRIWDYPDQLPSFEEDEFMEAYSPETFTKDKKSLTELHHFVLNLM